MECFSFAKTELSGEIVVLNTELTGIDLSKDKIIAISAIKLINGELSYLLHTYINPGQEIPEAATALHGIDNATVQNAPAIAEVLPKLHEFIGGAKVAVFNGRSEIAFLAQAGYAIDDGTVFLDVMQLAKQKMPYLARLGGYSLQNCLAARNMKEKRPYSANNAARNIARLLASLAKM
jgi:DNA polymerase III epsilon subunit-like protein